MIETKGLTKHFSVKGGTVEAVRGVDIRVEEGELVAFLGPNGAGKSTTLRMLTTLLPPTSGDAMVAGCDVRTDAAGVRARIGYIGQGSGAGNNQRVRDELITQGRCYGLSGAEARARADELLAALDLKDLAKRTAVSLSGGQRRRVDVALGLVHRPGLLFLDEPSTGLDPHNRANLWEHILRLREERGMTILLTTHYLDEADNMAERVLVIDHGRVIADDTPEALKANLAGDRITVTTRDDAEAHRAADVARGLPAAHEVTVNGTSTSVRTAHGDETLPRFLRTLDAVGVEVVAADLRRPTLDDVFLALTGRSLREGEAAS